MNYTVPGKTIIFPKEPAIFQKSLSSLVKEPTQLNLLEMDSPINHEVELGFIISKKGVRIPKDKAMEYVGGYFLLLDMTRASIGEFIKAGLSWCIGKSADEFLPVSKFIEVGSIRDPHDL